MKLPEKFRLLLGLSFLLVFGFGLISSVETGPGEELEVPLRGGLVLEVSSPLERVVLGDDQLARLQVVSSREILIFGKDTGRTTLHVWTERGLTRYLLRIRRDVDRQRRNILNYIDTETSEVELREFSPQYRDPEIFEDYITELLDRHGEVVLSDHEARKVFAVGPPDILDKIAALLQTLDVPGRETIFSSRIHLNHRSAIELLEEAEELLTENGKIVLDVETNSLLVVDLLENVERIESHLETIDVETVAQVRIEARFVEMSDEARREIGIDWSYDGTVSGEGAGAILGSQGLELGLGAAAPSELRAKMQMLESRGLVNLISSPNVMTRNQQLANLEIVDEQSSIGGWDVSYHDGEPQVTPVIENVEGGIELKVRPLITQTGLIQLELNSEMRVVELTEYEDPISPGFSARTFFVHEVDRRTAELNVALRNGQTLVIGGLDRERADSNQREVPLLSRIPIIGRLLFGHERDYQETRSLTIFLTAEIVDVNREEFEDAERDGPDIQPADTIPAVPGDVQ